MSAGKRRRAVARSFLEALEEVSEAVEAGAGLPAVARAAGRALDASVIVLDAVEQRAGGRLRVPRGRARGDGGRGAAPRRVELRVAEAAVGQLRYRPRGEPPPRALLRLVANLIGARGRAVAGARARERGRRGRLPARPARAQGHRSREHRRPRARSWAATSPTARA